MTMSTCDPQTGMHHLFAEVLREQLFTQAPECGFDEPWEESYIRDFLQQIEQHQDNIAAVILEPIVQGAGGMRFYSPHYLKRVREICDEYHVLLIADEIATGFGRTGELFACNHANISPDILCLGKSLTGGYMTLAATLCTEEVGQVVCSGEAGVLMHGPTFMANIGVIELKEAVDLREIQNQFVDQGVWIRPFGKLVYIMPPFVMAKDDLSFLIKGIKTVIASL